MSVNKSVSQSLHRSVCQSVSRSVGQSVIQSLTSENWNWLTFLYPELAKSWRSYKIRCAMISDKLAFVAKQHQGRTIIIFAASCFRAHNLFMFRSFCITVGSFFIHNVFVINGNGAIPVPWHQSRDERLLSPLPVRSIIWYLMWNERMFGTGHFLLPVEGGGGFWGIGRRQHSIKGGI